MTHRRPPGYVPETRRGQTLHRVRVEGDKARRITIPVGMNHPDFWVHYYAARRGRTVTQAPVEEPVSGTLRALVTGYLAWLDRQARTGAMSPLTARQRRSLLTRVCDMPGRKPGVLMGEYTAELKPAAMLHIIDEWGDVTGQADNSMKALRAAYAWAIPRGLAQANPALGVPKAHKPGGGAVPWTADDMAKFLRRWPEGSTPRLFLLLAAFTGARRDDLVRLGRGNETQRHGLTWLEWQPRKKGSAFVSLPMLPQLYEATRAAPVVGATYLLNAHGRPYANGNVLGNSVQDWTAAAGLEGRSSHGLRKALATLLAERGATQHQISAVLAHTKASTSEIYTRSAERAGLAGAALDALRGLKIG